MTACADFKKIVMSPCQVAHRVPLYIEYNPIKKLEYLYKIVVVGYTLLVFFDDLEAPRDAHSCDDKKHRGTKRVKHKTTEPNIPRACAARTNVEVRKGAKHLAVDDEGGGT